MRNQPKPLSYPDAMHAYKVQRNLLALPPATVVALHYTKRNGESSSSTGTIGAFKGADGYDTMSVDIHTETKGTRTINLVGVTKIEVL